ncbi:hypothetical protein EZS27_012151 [termite gut metagenome]|uniref:Uncharacterized protein n=1 Tax=termite gut metagenome TaxID=433724 RepID=A0A5J4S1F8_9ZZZZ
MTLQLLGRTVQRVATCPAESYSAFSPLPLLCTKKFGGYFLLRYPTLADSFLLGSRMLCVARTFLLHTSKRQTDRLFSMTKIHKFAEKPSDVFYSSQESVLSTASMFLLSPSYFTLFTALL